MKLKIGKYFTVFPIFALLVACAPMSPITSIHDSEALNATQSNESKLDHNALAKQYENLAREMQAKEREQEELLEHKPRSSFFGKNRRNSRSQVALKAHEYEHAAQEYLEKADFHRKIAAMQADQKSAAKMNRDNESINKAKRILNNKDTL